MKNVLDVLKERGYLKQTVYGDELYDLLGKEKVTFYIGYDPTADSLTAGHFVTLMAMAHMQRAGHRPIVLIGGGTAMVGDPSGRTDMRQMMTKETVNHNVECFKKQMSRFIDVSDGKAIFANNADWLCKLNYVDFLRDVGACFSVNKMLTAECYKQRLEKGLTFLEFNYMLMQAYDFLHLNREYGCVLELGGDDQWSNMLAGVDLVRRKEQKVAYAATFSLLTTSDGKKMGKTAKGAVWLDPNKTTPYDFFQYWRNVEDDRTETCLKLLTFLPLDEIAELTAHNDERMNAAKERLAYEVTAIVHGKEKADEVLKQVKASFSLDVNNMPEVKISDPQNIVDILVKCGQCKSNGEARRLVEGGGVSVNDQKITDFAWMLPAEISAKGEFVLHKGKKVHVKVIF
ncbi:MAG: tyrosine--tRNA ligase [Corallococcus sp.]|nr:tyrosine--tRNA ligase [Corallococcus sp.]MCM1359137.1 tyrosine--tRNA ligase [Corallococcus sp.]MCM1394527.1 tyrosine--tRNA ligase [Corallococcus sp.]